MMLNRFLKVGMNSRNTQDMELKMEQYKKLDELVAKAKAAVEAAMLEAENVGGEFALVPGKNGGRVVYRSVKASYLKGNHNATLEQFLQKPYRYVDESDFRFGYGWLSSTGSC